MKTWACLLILAAILAGCSKPESPPQAETSAQGVAEAAMDPPDAGGVVYLGKSPGFYVQTPVSKHRGFLVREFYRQALLLAAREELGLVTRDAWLGDAIPNEGSIRPFDLTIRAGTMARVEVLHGFPSSAKAVGNVDLPSFPTPAGYHRQLWTQAEEFSRTRFVEILKKSVVGGEPRAWKQDLALPAAVEESLREMAFLVQFKAARQIHDVIASQGQSPALLGALVRAYANLGVLTEFHWHPAHKVFKARAILYAQRWLALQPDSLPAQWHRAYALVLAGIHEDALPDLELAQKRWEATAEKDRPARPGWVALLDACCRYDIDKLAAELDRAEHGQLAALLHYHTVELAGNQRWALQTAGTTLEKIPGCYRVHDAVYNFGGVSVGHLATIAPIRVLGRTLYDQVQQMRGLPESVRGLAKRPADDAAAPAFFGPSVDNMGAEFEARAKLVAALREASRSPTASASTSPRPR